MCEFTAFWCGYHFLTVGHPASNRPKFEQDLKDIDLVIGAKGSPLQLVLSAVYHVDAPTGNIEMKDAEKIMKSPMVKKAIPLAYGDSYKGYRILGTTTDYLEKYNAVFSKGRSFENAMEANISAELAEKTGLKPGDTFLGTHGEAESGHVHDSHSYKVVGIFKNTNSVLDQLVLTKVESVWLVHDSHLAEEHEHKNEDKHEHEKGHEHDHSSEHEHKHEHEDNHNSADKDITAILLQFKTKMGALTMPRMVNEQTNMQAVIPALEINRLIYLIGVGATTLKFIAGGIMFMACFSIFFALFSRLKERKYELALMRSVGYRPMSLFVLLIYEGLLLAGIGYVLGWLLSRIALYFINQQAESDFNLQFGFHVIESEIWLLLISILVGIIASLLPALRAMNMDISKILSQK
jgi:putative ABC transport system permease protein